MFLQEPLRRWSFVSRHDAGTVELKLPCNHWDQDPNKHKEVEPGIPGQVLELPSLRKENLSQVFLSPEVIVGFSLRAMGVPVPHVEYTLSEELLTFFSPEISLCKFLVC